MKKESFLPLVLGVVEGLLFSLGLCMYLIPEWNAFSTGVAATALGAVLLLSLLLIAWKRRGKKRHIQWKLVGRIAFGILGIVLLLCLIPLCLCLK